MNAIATKELNALCTNLNVKEISDVLFFPKFFEVETVNACNAKCSMCTIGDWKERKSYIMPNKIWKKFLDEIQDYSDWVNRVNVGRDGEPLLDVNLEHKIRELKKIGIKFVTFATNCSLLSTKRIKSLLDSGLDDIMFSIDGYTKKTFKKIRKGLDFEQVINNCLNFITLRNSNNYKTSIRVRMVLQDENIMELEDWFKYWKPLLSKKDRLYAKPAHSWGNQLRTYRNITQKLNNTDYRQKVCVSPWSTMVVKVNGDIPLCPVDFKNTFQMGNINNSTIKEIWNSGKFNHIRKKMAASSKNEINLCNGCYLWDNSTIIEKELHDYEN